MVDDKGILKQCRIENKALEHTRKALLSMIDWPIEGTLFTRKLSGLRFLTSWFQQQIDRMFAIEEHDGYMDMAVEVAPHLASKIEALQKEHATLREKLHQIVTQLERTLPDKLAEFEQLCAELAAFLKSLDTHLHKESQLIQDAFSQDIGGEGGN